MLLRRSLVTLAVATALGVRAASPAAYVGTSHELRPNKTVVLVHGYFADGSGWTDVIRLLQQAGVNVVAVQNPLSSLADDVEATRRVIDRQVGPVVLVGHSWGGFVITNAGDDPKVESLVYVAAFAPEVGDSVASLTADYPGAWLGDLIYDDALDVTLSEAGYLAYFAPDLPKAQAKALYATQGAAASETLGTPATAAAWHARPVRYVLATQDQMIDPALQEIMSARMNAKVTRIPASHSVMVSHPEKVAAVILEAVLHP